MNKYEISKSEVDEKEGTIRWCEGWDISGKDTSSLMDGWYDRLKHFMVFTREQNIREGLIKLGWTPPLEDEP